MRLFLLMGFCWLATAVFAQEEKIKWLTIEEAERQYAKMPRPMIIDVYTDWCGWCKHMDKTTYSQPTIVSFINRYFYPVKINAESTDTIQFRGKIYPPLKNGERYISSLAAEMLKGKMSYPTTVFLYDKENVNIVVPGYLDVTKMEAFLIYFTENAYFSTNINDFIVDFEQVFTPGKEMQENRPEPYWISFQDLENKQKAENKKVLLYLSAPWSNSSKMMEQLVFPDSTFSSIAQRYYYCLHLDVLSQDTLTFMTHRFANAGKENNNLHQLAIALSDKILRVPSVYIFDEEGKLMESLYFYLDRGKGDMILDYIGSDTYKSMTWTDYVKMKSKEGF